MAETPTPKKKKERLWAPHIWEGCDFFAWARLLVRNRFAVHWSCLYVAVVVTFVSVFNLVLRFIQDAFYGRDIRRTPIRHPPSGRRWRSFRWTPTTRSAKATRRRRSPQRARARRPRELLTPT